MTPTYYLLPLLQTLRTTDDAEERDRLLRIIAVNVGDELALATLVGELPAPADFYPDRHQTPRGSGEAIESFMQAFGGAARRFPDPLENVVPAVDYASMAPLTPEECIKTGDYARAIEIIQTQHLNNPEKSVYFADQIRFLKKLLLIEAASRR